MNFARQKCDARVMQSVMRDDTFALQIGNEFSLHRRRLPSRQTNATYHSAASS
jgi:hypothetical protein